MMSQTPLNIGSMYRVKFIVHLWKTMFGTEPGAGHAGTMDIATVCQLIEINFQNPPWETQEPKDFRLNCLILCGMNLGWVSFRKREDFDQFFVEITS